MISRLRSVVRRDEELFSVGVCQDAQDSSRQLFLPLILGVLGRVQEVLMFILDTMMLEQPNLCQVVEASSG